MIYTLNEKKYEGKAVDKAFFNYGVMLPLTITIVSFTLAHWYFAFNYFTLAWRVDLVMKGKNPDSNNRQLNALNIAVSLMIVLFAAI